MMLAAMCIAALCLSNPYLAASNNVVTASDGTQIIVYDSQNLTNITSTSRLGIYAEAVRFTPPTTPWTLTGVQVVGWNFFDNVTLPEEGTIALEIRDKDLNLLYKMTDSHIPYFTELFPILAFFEIPPITMNDDFYVCFYDRGLVGVGYNMTNSSEENRSYRYNSYFGNMTATTLQMGDEQVSINWMIRAMGR